MGCGSSIASSWRSRPRTTPSSIAPYGRLKEIHADAFSWDPPDVSGLERLAATRMRQYVRAWINEWDLIRLDPGFVPETETVEIAMDYREDADLEGES